MPGTLIPLLETFNNMEGKPVNLSDFEMNRGVQHVDKGSILSFHHYYILNGAVFLILLFSLVAAPINKTVWLTMTLQVLLSHAKINIPANFEPVQSIRIVPMISLKSMLR